MTLYPPLETVLEEYSRRFAGGAVRDRGQVESNMARPASGYGDTEFYPEIIDKAAVYLHGFVSTQPFDDGNKRMGVLVANAFLQMNGWRLTLSDIELYDLTMAIADDADRMPLEKVAETLAASVVEMDLDSDDL